MHRLSVFTALLISFVIAYGTCVWAFSGNPLDLLVQAQASPLEIRASE